MNRYKLFVSPFAKVFLGAIFTYQVIHWTWLKLEMDESKAEKNSKFSFVFFLVPFFARFVMYEWKKKKKRADWIGTEEVEALEKKAKELTGAQKWSGSW